MLVYVRDMAKHMSPDSFASLSRYTKWDKVSAWHESIMYIYGADSTNKESVIASKNDTVTAFKKEGSRPR